MPDPVFVVSADATKHVLNGREAFHRSGAVFGGDDDTPTSRVSYGLLAMNGKEHRKHRLPLVGALRDRTRFRAYFDATTEAVHRLIAGWQVGQTIEVVAAMRQLSIRVIAAVTLGITSDRDVVRIAGALEDWISYSLLPSNRLSNKLAVIPSQAYVLSRRLEETVMAIVCERPLDQLPPIAAWLRSNFEAGDISRQAFIGQLVTLLSAGWETTSSALSWALLLLTQHKDMAVALTESLRSSAQPLGHAEAATHLGLTGVICETLRLFSPAIGVKRIAVGHQVVAGYDVPDRAEVICSQFVRHRDESVYVDALKFMPERWQTRLVQSADYFPFGLGWRRCVGDQLAVIQMRSALSYLLRAFSFRPASGTVVDYQVRLAMSPTPTLYLTLHPAGVWPGGDEVNGTWRRLWRDKAE
ncbi:MAG TPA: hypothetical protein DGG94_23435 [Micromonosporaceae bacterium]|nr:hypothetical protein [Micromonosporaceae bacterium]